jgi:gliding motility-associated-like protein
MIMIRPVTIIILILLLFHAPAWAQGQNNIWMFGQNVGLNFNGGAPKVFKAQDMDNRGGSTVVCDGAGKLLFYILGKTIYNSKGGLMPNSDRANPTFTTIQCPAVIPWVGHDKKYFVFYRDDRTSELLYSIVDMTLDNGLGDIIPTQKDIFLDDSVSVKILPVPGSGCNTWLLIHKIGSNEFRTYKIYEPGIDKRYVSSRTGLFNNRYSYLTCNMDISRNGTIAVGSGEDAAVELFTFERDLGIVKDPILLDTFSLTGRVHSVCFSPDGSKLYVSGGPGGSDLLQYNMWAPQDTPSRINPPGVYVNGALRRGPDGKVYSANWEGVYSIDKPDTLGIYAGFSDSSITLPANVKSAPGFMGSDIIFASLNYAGSTTIYDICNPDTFAAAAAANFGIAFNNSYNLPTRVSGQWEEEKDIVRIQTTLKECVLTTDTAIFVGCNCMQIPNAFTPNGDGKNDLFRIKGDDIVSLDLMVYNRWGQRVFISVDRFSGWDGTFNGKPCEIGTYYFYAIARCGNGKIIRRSGDIALIR